MGLLFRNGIREGRVAQATVGEWISKPLTQEGKRQQDEWHRKHGFRRIAPTTWHQVGWAASSSFSRRKQGTA